MTRWRVICGAPAEVEIELDRLEQEHEPLTVLGFSTSTLEDMIWVTILVTYQEVDL